LRRLAGAIRSLDRDEPATTRRHFEFLHPGSVSDEGGTKNSTDPRASAPRMPLCQHQPSPASSSHQLHRDVTG
jgi:hypothetical protein